ENTVLTAAALQDHLVKSLGLGDFIGPRHVGTGPAAKARAKKDIKSTIDTGRFGRNHPVKKKVEKDREYVLDPKPPPLTLAQKFGLVEAPAQPLTENEWQVLLSCTHACLQAFERFTGRKTCPMCRREQYQTRLIHEGSRHHLHKSATRIQACWRGYVVRCMYQKLQEANPPKDPKLRQKFYEEKLSRITERMVRSCDFNVGDFLREMDQSLAASRNVFRDFDARFKIISEEEWEHIQLKAVERANQDCPICLTALATCSDSETTGKDREPDENNTTQTKPTKDREPNLKNSRTQKFSANAQTKSLHSDKSVNHDKTRGTSKSKTDTNKRSNEEDKSLETESAVRSIGKERQTVLLSCSHVFHAKCLEMFEELSLETRNTCPVCRALYEKKVLNV
ncbi:RNF32-like protein, partial [Mya arenaria]